jgi:hypothetical protein
MRSQGDRTRCSDCRYATQDRGIAPQGVQASEQLQGEAFEHEVEATLRHQFPQDLIEPIPVGEVGGDILQRVRNATGQLCGALLWELKATKTWNERWLAKLRDDQRAAEAGVALLVSNVLPKGCEAFGCVDDGVWVTPLPLRHARSPRRYATR